MRRRRQTLTKADHHNTTRRAASERFGEDISEELINKLMDDAAERFVFTEDDDFALRVYRVCQELIKEARENAGHKSMLEGIENRLNKDRHKAMGWG